MKSSEDISRLVPADSRQKARQTEIPTHHDAVFLIEPTHGTIVGVTNGIKYLTGFDPVDLVGKPFIRLYTAPAHRANSSSSESIPERVPGETIPLSFHCADGNARTFSVTFSALQGEETERTYMAILREITPTATSTVDSFVQKQLEHEALKSLFHELKREPITGEFLSELSHQVRTPLGIILSSTGILGRYENVIQDPVQRAEYLDSISRSVERITTLLEDVVQLTKLQLGEVPFQSEPISLTGFFHSIIEEARAAAPKKIPISLTHHDIPPLAHGDEALLRLIFLHLISNAFKFSTDEHPIQITLNRQDEQCVIAVHDHGIGLNAFEKELIFLPFKRGRNVGDIPGNGLGLSIVRQCVALHRGTITCDSTARSGTVFLVSLPLLGSA